MANLRHKNCNSKQGKFKPGLDGKKPPFLDGKKPDSDTLLLDTLAQLGTNLSDTEKQKPANPYYKRAIAKYITNEIIFPLVDLKSPLEKSYWNTFHCVKILLQEGKKMTGKYCNNRWCLVCNRIRTAKLINAYLGVLKDQVKNPYFITLTIPNVASQELRYSIDEMIKTINRINNLFRHRRNFRLAGIRKLEVTYNSTRCNFHPHFHFIVDTKHAGLALISQWLNRYPDAVMEAQDIRRADEGMIIELFKYFTKLTTKNQFIRVDGKAVLKIYAEQLDTIFQSMYNRRVFQPMGISKQPVSEDIEEIESQVLEQLRDEVNAWTWEHEISDWVTSDGELLTGCDAHKKYIIKTEKEKL